MTETTTTTRARFTVRVTRDDGSVTYKCDRVGLAHAERERDAWIAEGWSAAVCNVADPETRADVKRWSAAIRDGGRYWPRDD